MFTTQMIAAAPTVVQKPLTSKGDTILSVIQSMNALMRRRTIPSERITAGSVSRMTIGRMTALTKTNTSAANESTHNVASELTPANTNEATQKASRLLPQPEGRKSTRTVDPPAPNG